MNHSLLKSSLLILFGALVMPFFTIGCGSRLPDETEVTYRFSTTGENCQGISYGWVNESGVTGTCHELFTNGDVEVDCPVPESVSILIDNGNDLEQISSASSYISVSESSTCLARCEIWISGDLSVTAEILTIEGEHIANCRAKIN